MATYTKAFSGGVTPIPAWGSKAEFYFVNTWVNNDTWSVQFGVDIGDSFTLGVGFFNHLTPTCLTVFKDRIYVGAGSRFVFSENGEPTLFGEENPGAGFIPYTANFSGQDSIAAMMPLQGRMVVIGRRSAQIWNVDAAPASFALSQSFDNIGTQAPLSVQKIGDFDVIYLDDTGFRSFKTLESTLNATFDDVGLAVDDLVKPKMTSTYPAAACSIADPVTKNYWCFVKDTIFVLSKHPASNVTAWSTFLPTAERSGTYWAKAANYDVAGKCAFTVSASGWVYWTKGNATAFVYDGITASETGFYYISDYNSSIYSVGTPSGACTSTLEKKDQVTFTPQKFVINEGIVYVRSTSDKVLAYGGTTGLTYDGVQAIALLPWLDDKSPAMNKQSTGVKAVLSGAWALYASTVPGTAAASYQLVWEGGSATAPDSNVDSPVDIGRVPFEQSGTHFSFYAASSVLARTNAKLASLLLAYNQAGVE